MGGGGGLNLKGPPNIRTAVRLKIMEEQLTSPWSELLTHTANFCCWWTTLVSGIVPVGQIHDKQKVTNIIVVPR